MAHRNRRPSLLQELRATNRRTNPKRSLRRHHFIPSPVYLAEIAKKDRRGRIIVIQQLAIEWGIFIMFFAGYGCSFMKGSASFRTAWGIQFIPALFLMAGLPFLPRSPRWLAKVGRTEQAIQVLADIQAHGNQDDPLVIAEWE